jgi:hypothetical protein
MRSPPKPVTSYWFASLVALLVALGAQSLLGAIVPAGVADWFSGTPSSPNIIYIAGVADYWPLATAVRFASFFVGGFVAAVVARRASVGFAVLLAGVSLLPVPFENVESPDVASIYSLYIWALAGLVGMCLGAGIARLTGRVA